MSLESFSNNPQVLQEEGKEKVSEGSRRFSLEEEYFDKYMNQKILDSYEDEFKKFHFSEEQIDEFRYKVLDLTPDQRERLFAIPWEVKEKNMPFFLKKINSGSETMSSYVDLLVKLSTSQHRRVGYHTDSILFNAGRQKTGEYWDISWRVLGGEKDHRDSDNPMAYYSFDYKNLYRVRNPRYIYIVCIEEDPKTGHRKDGNNQWGRATSLSVK